MRVVIAPDKFKGSLSAAAVAEALAVGVRRAIPDADIRCVPMADGGEGTLDALLGGRRGVRQELSVRGPLGAPRTAAIGVFDRASHVVIELSQAAGFQDVPAAQRNPLLTSTYGVGELLVRALDHGADRITLTLGGSATVDGGAGLMQAVGLTLIGRDGQRMPPGVGGGALADIHRLEFDGLHPHLADASIEIACDVLNPLCGLRGAAAVFAPQKGADEAGVRRLEEGLSHWADLWEAVAGRRLRDEPGTGAAGGVALPLLAAADGVIVPGVDVVIEAVGLRERVAGARLIITGEGRIDGQSRMGKVVDGVLRLARSAGVPCAAACGALGEDHEQLTDQLVGVVSLSELAGSAESAMADPARWLTEAGERLARIGCL